MSDNNDLGERVASIAKQHGISLFKAYELYCKTNGNGETDTHEIRKQPMLHLSPESNGCPGFLVSPVSEGQSLTRELKELAARDAYTSKADKNVKRLFKLARDVCALQLKLGRKLVMAERELTFDEWYWRSQRFLDSTRTREDYWISFLAKIEKVHTPTGEDPRLQALENVSKLSRDQLVVIPGWPDAPESWRRLPTGHREMQRASRNGTYILSYRDAAKFSAGMSGTTAHDITLGVLVPSGVVEIVNKGKAGSNSKEAAEFRYLLPEGKPASCPSRVRAYVSH